MTTATAGCICCKSFAGARKRDCEKLRKGKWSIMRKSSGGMARRNFLKNSIALGALSSLGGFTQPSSAATSSEDDRQYWIEVVTRVSGPVLHALSERKLKATMPVECPQGNVEDRKNYTYLEAMGRLLAGLAPWLESGATSGAEGELRNRYAELARMAIQSGTDPQSPDYMNFSQGRQPVVDASYLGLAILRAPTELWQKLDKSTQRNVTQALQDTRACLPFYNNWLLFAATIEAALSFMGARWDPMRVDYAVRTLDAWYAGDGIYGDGPSFHWDYYNSYVIHPMLLNILDAVSKSDPAWKAFQPAALARARRYAAIQERLISPEGAYPPIGRSLCYRFGAFHLLSEISLRRQLPEGVYPEQVRCALTAVMRHMIDAPGTFDEQGWLRVGFNGHQPAIAEPYISTGSLYLCSAAWLPLGLPATDPFWAGEARPWTSKKFWSGENVKADHALADDSRKQSSMLR
jgi:hypothetical protein